MPSSSVKPLKKRADFLAMRGCKGKGTQSFLLVWRARDDGLCDIRLGLTVTKKIGGAVCRNRIKRRFRAAAREIFSVHATPGMDYALIARAGALERDFPDLLDDMKRALLSVPATPK